jgi:valyl-tRNA synthetase
LLRTLGLVGEDFTDTVESIRPELKTLKYLIRVDEGLSKANSLKAVEFEDLVKNGRPAEPPAEIDEDDLHTLFYTSGTTGKPTLVAYTRDDILDWATSLDWDWVISRQRIFGTPIPAWTCKKCRETIVARRDWLPVDPRSEKPLQRQSLEWRPSL